MFFSMKSSFVYKSITKTNFSLSDRLEKTPKTPKLYEPYIFICKEKLQTKNFGSLGLKKSNLKKKFLPIAIKLVSNKKN